MEKKTTIYDIAKALNTTVSTVSRALNNHPMISEETKRAVSEMAVKLKYRPNKVAKSLSSGKSHLIGVIVPSANIQFFSSVIHSLELHLKESRYKILLYQSNESLQSEKEGIETLLEAQVDGIILSLSLESDHIGHVEKLCQEGIPVIVFDRIHASLNVPTVTIDDFKAGKLATEHLIAEGYRKIAYVSTRHNSLIFKQRMEGYKEALKNAGIPYREELVILDELSILSGIKATDRFLSLHDRPDAIIGGDDFTALGIMKALNQQGIVPPEIGVIGFANQTFSEFISPGLSTIDQQAEIMGQECANLFLRLVNQSSDKESIVLDPKLIVRQSSQKSS